MRIAVFILAAQILALLSQPCEDTFGPAALTTANGFVAEQTFENSRPESEPEEDCSPFCICTCRQVPAADVSSLLPENVELPIIVTTESEFQYDESLIHLFRPSIWQPPRS